MRRTSIGKNLSCLSGKARNNVDAGWRASSIRIISIACLLAKAASFPQSLEDMLSIHGVEMGPSSESSDEKSVYPCLQMEARDHGAHVWHFTHRDYPHPKTVSARVGTPAMVQSCWSYQRGLQQ